MCTIDIGIGHDHDLVITELGDIKVVAISFGKTTAKCIDHGLDLCICKNLVNSCLFYIEDLTTDRKDRLIITVSGCLGRTACGISLYDKNLTLGWIFALTVGKLSIGIKGIFLLGQKIGLGSFLCLADLGCLFCTGKDRS